MIFSIFLITVFMCFCRGGVWCFSSLVSNCLIGGCARLCWSQRGWTGWVRLGWRGSGFILVGAVLVGGMNVIVA